jgi:hypothetical protein
VTLPVDVRVEGRWPAALRPELEPVGVLVGLARDGCLDSAPAQVTTVAAGGVSLVSQDPVGSGAGPAGRPGHADGLQHRDELRAVATVSGGQHDGEGFLALLAAQVQFRGQPAAGAAQRVIGRLDGDPTRWFGLQIPLLRAPAAC